MEIIKIVSDFIRACQLCFREYTLSCSRDSRAGWYFLAKKKFQEWLELDRKRRSVFDFFTDVESFSLTKP